MAENDNDPNIIIEYTCTECKSLVSETDAVCPNCGADLTHEVKYIRFSKPYHRFIYYLVIFPILYFIFHFVVLTISEKLDYSTIDIYFIVFIEYLFWLCIPLLHTFYFVRLSKTNNIIIGLSTGIVSIISMYILNYFGYESTSGCYILTLILYESVFSFVKKEKYLIPYILSTIFILWFYLCGLEFVPKNQLHDDLTKYALIKNARDNSYYDEYATRSQDNKLFIYLIKKEKTDTFYTAIYYKKSFKWGVPRWEFVKYDKKLSNH